MKRFFSLLTFIVITLCSYAHDVEVNGIYYNLVAKAKEATVTYKGTSNVYYPDIYTGSVTIPSTITVDNVKYSVTSIGESAFSHCSGLTSVTIPNSVTVLGWEAFRDCFNLTLITIPNSVTTIGKSAFYYCTNLTSITIPNSVTSIEESAFKGCSGLTSITIPNSVTSIGASAFSNCSGLTSIIISNSVKTIETYTFNNCSSLTSITIPNSVTKIEFSAFSDCTSLTSINIPNSVRVIDQFAFFGSGLTSITIPNSVTRVERSAFSRCTNLTSVTIGSSVLYILSEAFAKCENLETVICLAENVPTTETDAFEGSYVNYATLIVPAASLNAYKSKAPWSQFGTFKTVEGNTPSTNKCAAPSIAYENGKLYYVTATPGAQIVSEVKSDDFKKSYDNIVSLTATYNITAYATKSGYNDSETSTATLHWVNGTLDVATGAKEFGAKRAVLVSSNDGFVNISGLNDGEKVEAYSVDGKHIITTYATGNSTNISAKSGETIILKIGNETIKTTVK